MFGLFKRKKEIPLKEIDYNYSKLGVDMHSHVLPGIDDGAQTPEDSIFLIKKMIELGIQKVIATPHVMIDYYRNTPESINNALAILKEALAKEQINIPVEAAAEHYFDETFPERIETGNLMLMKDNYVLFELSFITPPPNLVGTVQRMREKGYKPILAHPERYSYMNIDEISILYGWGCAMQINTVSLAGYYGAESKKMAEAMVDHGLVDFISSDMHHPRHAAALEKALHMPYVEKLLHDYPLKNKLLL